MDAGATLVATTLTETRTYLSGLEEIPRIPSPQADEPVDKAGDKSSTAGGDRTGQA
jgi:hypothetical protein